MSSKYLWILPLTFPAYLVFQSLFWPHLNPQTAGQWGQVICVSLVMVGIQSTIVWLLRSGRLLLGGILLLPTVLYLFFGMSLARALNFPVTGFIDNMIMGFFNSAIGLLSIVAGIALIGYRLWTWFAAMSKPH